MIFSDLIEHPVHMAQECLGREWLGNKSGLLTYGIVIIATYENGFHGRFELQNFIVSILAVFPWHYHIKNEQVDLRRVQKKFINSVFTVTSFDYPATGPLKNGLDESPQIHVVISNQHRFTSGDKGIHAILF